jgi:hypothetical protein
MRGKGFAQGGEQSLFFAHGGIVLTDLSRYHSDTAANLVNKMDRGRVRKQTGSLDSFLKGSECSLDLVLLDLKASRPLLGGIFLRDKASELLPDRPQFFADTLKLLLDFGHDFGICMCLDALDKILLGAVVRGATARRRPLIGTIAPAS